MVLLPAAEILSIRTSQAKAVLMEESCGLDVWHEVLLVLQHRA